MGTNPIAHKIIQKNMKINKLSCIKPDLKDASNFITEYFNSQ